MYYDMIALKNYIMCAQYNIVIFKSLILYIFKAITISGIKFNLFDMKFLNILFEIFYIFSYRSFLILYNYNIS